ncbi:MAG: alpha-1,4-glucan--maltose-1-phosphate maltosyltransferase [Panacagrimonas sp.]
MVALKKAPRSSPPSKLVPKALLAAVEAPRVIVDEVAPSVDGGRYAAKGVVGRVVEVAARVFADGHEALSAEMLWKAPNAPWQRVTMAHAGNDRWTASFTPHSTGQFRFAIEAWIDGWNGFRHGLEKLHAANRVTPADIREGVEKIKAAAAESPHNEAVAALARSLPLPSDEATLAVLLDEAAARDMASADPRRFLVRHPELSVDVERKAAGFASWYELFPRSQSTSGAHGTFDDVIPRLPAIAAMGFDVLYMPPIHPIGSTKRKGPNNSLVSGADDPGSPYAIGSPDGGHDAVHPQLGGIEAFRRLRDAAAAHGMELALDFAIQCSPDHLWLQQHPGWFSWRADGTLRCAENPPKKYEDIVNVDFYATAAIPSLWIALRDVIEYWVSEGVNTFRVDNPHTKPLPFWEWMIADVRSRHPDVLFLAEAFTRPAMMYRLAKVGFAQSYTYFTWRNGKQELTDYLTELTQEAPRDFFRPHFFVNTPDINPPFLQTSGRAGFVIRAALAGTLSGLWGLYSGFELCESAPLPGREEYLDSEKYELRPRDWSAPGNIITEITRLNELRRAYPALQSHLGVKFHAADNEHVLCYSKQVPGDDSLLLVAVSLDPLYPQGAHFEVPLEQLDLEDDAVLEVEELMSRQKLRWQGRRQHWYFEPRQMPFAIWRLSRTGN